MSHTAPALLPWFLIFKACDLIIEEGRICRQQSSAFPTSERNKRIWVGKKDSERDSRVIFDEWLDSLNLALARAWDKIAALAGGDGNWELRLGKSDEALWVAKKSLERNNSQHDRSTKAPHGRFPENKHPRFLSHSKQDDRLLRSAWTRLSGGISRISFVAASQI